MMQNLHALPLFFRYSFYTLLCHLYLSQRSQRIAFPFAVISFLQRWHKIEIMRKTIHFDSRTEYLDLVM